ncbi:helix-turn-helix domain-containing protein [Azospirillum sp. RWY-5-1]|uniref:Helix-turn-helix domain-containing protein n=1 Tax=Azospirillum oleiclasticum TaxID=2735135 RepID=A0ABX2THC8_9PROT|nr:helix-turn-helix domain-containing protein [Azospirillum oleiclasticum]NYZ22568.1 helix-turn-helix domain-containing protein [Azospirillum oleiclasticum]
MGWVVMSERDVRRVEVLAEVAGGRLTVGSAASVLGLSERQVWRLVRRYRTGGGGAIVHRARGRPSNNRLGPGLRGLALEGYLAAHGRPLAFYSDKHSVFRVARREAKGGQGMTQFGRALAELNIEILCANSSQAKGRVERVNRTLQDRLVKELRLAGIGGIEAGNAFLPGFMERFNARFAVAPARPEDLHRPVELPAERLRTILCWRERRHVGQQLTLSYERRRVMLEETELTRGLVGQYVDTYAYADGRLEIRWQGIPLPYTAFDKDQRVGHAAIVENKRLGAALAWVKAMQDAQPPPTVKTNSERNGYRKTGRKPPGRKGFVDKRAEARAGAGLNRPR